MIRNRWFRQHPWRARAFVLLPLLAGLVSVLKGQDGNWDLLNYHLYNPWAWLNDRLTSDLAPVGIQTFFNPLIDLPYYLMIQWLPGPLVGFVMGVAHGLVAIPLFLVCRHCLGSRDGAERVAFWLTLAGLLGIATLAGLGNTMGDHLTAVPAMAALAVLVGLHARTVTRPSLGLALAGGLLGLAVGLKLTNALYVAAACSALLFAYPARAGRRLHAAVVVGAIAVAVFAVIAGPWHWQLWQEFGNPLFPQFNAWFQSPLAPQTTVADQRWQPDGWLQAVFWPLLISIDPARAGDKPLPQIVFAVLFILFLAWPAARMLARRAGRTAPRIDSPQFFLLVFIAAAWVVWMLLFGVYRYLAPLEMLAPLAIWILAQQVWPGAGGRCLGRWLVVAVTIYSVANFTTWGTRPWAMTTVSVEPPVLEAPGRTAFILPEGEPMSWMIPWLPEESTYVALGRMPETPAYVERALSILGRQDSMQALVYTHRRLGAQRVERLNRRLADWAVAADGRLCGLLEYAAGFTSSIEPAGRQDGAAKPCRFDYVKYSPEDLARMNEWELQRVVESLQRYGLDVDRSSCRLHDARLGGEPEPYRLCTVRFGQ